VSQIALFVDTVFANAPFLNPLLSKNIATQAG
jgi:hypothetical protein